MSTAACKAMCRLLESGRHAYPETLGVADVEEEVFDSRVYPSKGGTQHSLRCPFQSKDGKGGAKLELVRGGRCWPFHP